MKLLKTSLVKLISVDNLRLFASGNQKILNHTMEAKQPPPVVSAQNNTARQGFEDEARKKVKKHRPVLFADVAALCDSFFHIKDTPEASIMQRYNT